MLTGFLELLDLLRTTIRGRLGLAVPITGGHAPRPTRKGGSTMLPLLDDALNGWRRLARQPRAALGAIALLTLAIGVTSAMFTVVDAFIVRPAPFRDPDTLAQVWIQRGSVRLDVPIVRAWRDSGHFASVLPTVINVVGEFDGPNGPDERMGARVTPGTFADFGVSPMLGREFIPGEGADGNDDYVLLSAELWQEVFASDPGIVGKLVNMSGRPTVVVGVMPPRLRFPIRGGGMWRALDLDRPPAVAARTQLMAFVRRAPGMPQADADRLAGEVVTRLSGSATVASRPLGSQIDDYSRESMISLAIGVGLVFVLLCANVTNLILARTSARRAEFGICSALGASRRRLLRQVLLENVAIGICATMLGLGLAYALVALARVALPEDLLWRTLNELNIDPRAVFATSAIGFLAVLLAGIPAAWLGTRTNVHAAIGQSRGGTDTAGSRRLTRGLLVVEVAMAVAVLASAGLHVRSFVNLVNADRGMDTSRVLVASIALPGTAGTTGTSASVIASDIESRLRALPGIERVTRASNVPPDQGSLHFRFSVQTDLPDTPPVSVELMRSYYVTPGFFDTFGIQLAEGRSFEYGDDVRTVVVSEKLGQQLFGDFSPVNRTITLWKDTYRIVGVATEIRNSMTEPREDHPEFYMLWTPSAAAVKTMTFGIRCASPCASAESIRQAIASMSAGIEVTAMRPLSDDFLEQLSRPRTAAVVASAFSGLALLATAAGLYGVLAYAVSRRRREFGIRAALGAHPADLRRLVLRDGLVVTIAGVFTGLGAGWGLARWLASVQYGVTFFDPLTWSIVTVTVVTVAIAASWTPARTAMRVDPSEMLREP
jgi:putative ABC transport system permease protein